MKNVDYKMKKFVEIHNTVASKSIFSPIEITTGKEVISVSCKYFKFSLPKEMKNNIDSILEFMGSKMSKHIDKEHCIVSIQNAFEIKIDNEIKYFLPLCCTNSIYLYEIINEHYKHYNKSIPCNEIISNKPNEILKQLLQLNGIKYSNED